MKWSEANGRLEFLFFASSPQVELMQWYPDILLMDSTYKTSPYGRHFSNEFFFFFAFSLENQNTSIPGQLNNSTILSENGIFVCRTSS